MTIEININVDDAAKMLKKVGRGLDHQKMLKMVGLEQMQWIDKNFEDQGTEGAWKQLSDATKMARRKGKKKRLGVKILMDTGTLRKSFTSPRGILKRGYNFITIGTRLEYAATHEYGNTSRGIPQRKILPKDKTAESLAANILKAYLEKVLKDAGA